MLRRVSAYVTEVLEDTAENISGGLDLRDIQAAFSDLVSDVRGTIQQAANDLAGGLVMKPRFDSFRAPVLHRRLRWPASSWAMTKRPSFASGARNAAKPSRKDLSGNLIVQLGLITEDLNRLWYERSTGRVITNVQQRVKHPVLRWMAATLDGLVDGKGTVFEAKFMLPWSFSEETAAAKYMPQLQHNMWVTNSKAAVLSIITGGGKWVEITVTADTLYQHLLLTAERKFWRCVEGGETPHLFGIEPPRPRIEAVRTVDMTSSNAWAEFASVFCSTRQAFLKHERSKAELKALMPEDAKEATGHGIRAKRSKSGAISFDLFEREVSRA